MGVFDEEKERDDLLEQDHIIFMSFTLWKILEARNALPDLGGVGGGHAPPNFYKAPNKSS